VGANGMAPGLRRSMTHVEDSSATVLVFSSVDSGGSMNFDRNSCVRSYQYEEVHGWNVTRGSRRVPSHRREPGATSSVSTVRLLTWPARRFDHRGEFTRWKTNSLRIGREVILMDKAIVFEKAADGSPGTCSALIRLSSGSSRLVTRSRVAISTLASSFGIGQV